ncbi:MAG: outer membrane protein transport protein [Candidatus Omnitrophota bacterium]
MFKRYYIFIVLLIGGILILSVNESAYASNATRELGFSARDSAMAGATTASPYDTSCLVKNPAGLVWIGNRIDAMYQSILPHDVTMETQGGTVPSAAAPLNAVALPAVGQIVESNVDYLPGVDAGISYRIPGTDKYPTSVGCGIFTIAGLRSNFTSPRLNTFYMREGTYETMMDLRSVRVAPGIAVAFNDKLSFGGTGNIAIQALRSNMARSLDFLETRGNANWDLTAGGGFTLGLLYKFSKMLNLGASFESHTWMGYHDKYKDCLHLIDEPPVVNVGIAFKPIENFEFTYDTRYINWTDVKICNRSPIQGGFGWGDQWVFAVGGEYTYKDKVKLRLGYNYGKSPIQSNVVFANALLPLVMEHHLTTGFSYFLTKDLSLDFVWEHHFKGVQTDNGAGDIYSAAGRGTKVTAAAEIISAGLGYKF